MGVAPFLSDQACPRCRVAGDRACRLCGGTRRVTVVGAPVSSQRAAAVASSAMEDRYTIEGSRAKTIECLVARNEALMEDNEHLTRAVRAVIARRNHWYWCAQRARGMVLLLIALILVGWLRSL